MKDIESWEIKGKVLEYIDETHTYIYDSIILPSVTQILKTKFANKYSGIDEKILKRASELGTMTHEAIELYIKEGKESDLKELRNFKFLKKAHKFECVDSEVPIVLFKDDVPVAAGRLDLVLKEGEDIGLADIKRVATLDKEYLAYQLNFYKKAYEQCYDKKISFLRALHLRNDTRKYVDIKINESVAMELLNEYLGGKENG